MVGTLGPKTNESTAVELVGGNMMINMRNYRRGGAPQMRAVAISADGGESWGEE